MMRSLRSRLVVTATALVTLAAAGCRTPANLGSGRASFNAGKEELSPFVEKGDYPDQLGRVLQSVLAGHRFSHPWLAMRAQNSSIWFVAERFESGQRFDRIYVHVTSEEAVDARITAFGFMASDWAELGKIFVDFEAEAKTIAAEIVKELADKRHFSR